MQCTHVFTFTHNTHQYRHTYTHMPIITSAHLHPRQAQRVGKTAQASQRGEARQLHVLLRPLHQRARPPHHRTCVGEMDELCDAYYRLDMIRLLPIFTLILVSTLTVIPPFYIFPSTRYYHLQPLAFTPSHTPLHSYRS